MPAAHHPPSSPPGQYFVLGIWTFDITAAQDILRDHPREPARLPVADWARAYGLGRDPGSGTIPLQGPGPDIRERLAGFDPEFVEGVIQRWQPGHRVRFKIVFPDGAQHG